MVNMGELFKFDVIGAVPMSRVPAESPGLERSLLEEGDLLFARRSLTLAGAGRCALVGFDDEPRTFESSMIRVRLDRKQADPRFYFYFFRSPQGTNLMATITEQVAVAGIRSSDLALLDIPHPELREQRAIAAVLGALDEKIQANYRVARTAQDLARTELKNAIAAGSQVVKIGDLLEPVNQRARTLDASFPYVGLEHFDGFDLALWKYGVAADSKSASKLAQRGDLLFGRIRPYFGNIAIAGKEAVVAQSVDVLRPIVAEYREVAQLCASSAQFVEMAAAHSSGTTMPQVKWVDVASSLFEVPLLPIAARFQRLSAPLLDLSVRLPSESLQLRELRDALLPGLLSGRLRVRDAEEVVEGAV